MLSLLLLGVIVAQAQNPRHPISVRAQQWRHRANA